MKIRIAQMAVILSIAFFFIIKLSDCSIVPVEKMIISVQTNSTAAFKENTHTWNYKDTENWKYHYKHCDGSFQSPIDIEPNKSKPFLYDSFMFGYYAKPIYLNVTNTGHTVIARMAPNNSSDKSPFVQGGGLCGRYNFTQFHLHWGNNSKYGSEHTIQKRSYPAEVHLVHFNVKYGSFTEAVKYKDGLAVLAIFVELGKVDNKVLAPVVSQLQKIKKSGNEAMVPEPIRLLDLLPTNTERFFRYHGSLTTPGCQEIVTWTVFERVRSFSERQLVKFQKLLGSDGKYLVNNFRPVRKNGAKIAVYRNWAFRNKAP